MRNTSRRYRLRRGASPELGGVTEIRIHGVGGTTPETMLFDPFPVQVAGDGIAGFYRTEDEPGRHVEAYSWGGLTSRESSRAAWLFLLPFSIMNFAGWTQRSPVPAATGQGDPRRTPVGRFILALSLSLTVLVAVGISVVTTDLVGYQCGGQPACTSKKWWLTPLRAGPLADRPGMRVAAGALMAGAVMVGFAALARRSRNLYEATPVPALALDGSDRPVLARASTWRGRERVLRLGRFHLAAALGSVTAMGAVAAEQLADAAGRSTAPPTALAVVASMVVVAAVLAVAMDLRRLGRPLLLLAAGAFVLTLVVAALIPPVDGPERLATQRGPELVFGVQLLLLLALGGLIFLQRRPRPEAPRLPDTFRWAAPLVFAALAVLMTGAVLAGIAVRVADLLGTPVAGPDGSTTGAALAVPVSFDWAALAFAVIVVTLAVEAALFLPMRLGKLSKEATEAVQAEYDLRETDDPIPHDNPDHRGWATGVAKARRLTERLHEIDLFVSVTVLVMLVLLAAGYAAFIRWDSGAVTDFPAIAGRWHLVKSASTWLIALLPLGGIWLLTNSWRGAGQRKQLGIVWDLATYWPRWFSPWGPPCYSERAIPDLLTRIGRLVDEGHGRVIVSAHSQGSVLAATALRLLPDRHLASVAVITYGSPLGQLYRWLFPAHWGTFDGAEIATRLAPTAVPRWHHFWRRTDPIGAPLFEGSDPGPAARSTELVEPRERRHPPGDPWPAIAGHSHYLEDPALVDASATIDVALGALPHDS